MKPPTAAKSRPEPEPAAHTLADLKNWERPGVWLAVVGMPVRHSISPQMHNAALARIVQRHPEYAGWRYVRFEIDPDQLSEALPLFHRAGFYGLNLTLPHKVRALDLVEAVDPEAARMGAVNTLVRTEHGYRGFNTDGYGLRTGIYSDLGAGLRDADVVLLGAGGASRAAAVQCLKDGCRSLWIGNRSADRLQALLAHLKEASPDGSGWAGKLRGFVFSDIPDALPAEAVVIHATSAGLNPDDAPPMDFGRFRPPSVCYDMIYNPPRTTCMRAAEAAGMSTANGLSMLVHQGVRALEIWTQTPVSAEAMETAARQALDGEKSG